VITQRRHPTERSRSRLFPRQAEWTEDEVHLRDAKKLLPQQKQRRDQEHDLNRSADGDPMAGLQARLIFSIEV
jgi:hypothetical protein